MCCRWLLIIHFINRRRHLLSRPLQSNYTYPSFDSHKRIFRNDVTISDTYLMIRKYSSPLIFFTFKYKNCHFPNHPEKRTDICATSILTEFISCLELVSHISRILKSHLRSPSYQENWSKKLRHYENFQSDSKSTIFYQEVKRGPTLELIVQEVQLTLISGRSYPSSEVVSTCVSLLIEKRKKNVSWFWHCIFEISDLICFKFTEYRWNTSY